MATNIHLLYKAVSEGDVQAVKSLVDSDSILCQQTIPGEGNPLVWAAKGGNAQIVTILLERGTPVNASEVPSPLHFAVQLESTVIAQLLIEAGADVEASDTYGQTPMHWAAIANSPGAIDLLVDHGANVDATDELNWTAIHHAGDKGSFEAAERLVSRGAQLNAVDEDGLTPLFLAATRYEKGHDAIFGLQLKHGAEFSLEVAIALEMTTLVRALIAAEPTILQHTERGVALLTLAVERANDNIVELLLANGAASNSAARGELPLITALATNASDAVIETLSGSGADPQARATPASQSPCEYVRQHRPERMYLFPMCTE